jgi:hypothetical protein
MNNALRVDVVRRHQLRVLSRARRLPLRRHNQILMAAAGRLLPCELWRWFASRCTSQAVRYHPATSFFWLRARERKFRPATRRHGR